eukprot:TRINITY_DN3999_c0_g1_i2.p1 TRINITY_DN3999_c0_g1~~TRINITY_DN3999_c0_g1_i2.p1  ORF type:complete len:126 (+),score=14.04 TRINITY_DN3999_c0_g1_i2:293-670(+)
MGSNVDFLLECLLQRAVELDDTEWKRIGGMGQKPSAGVQSKNFSNFKKFKCQGSGSLSEVRNGEQHILRKTPETKAGIYDADHKRLKEKVYILSTRSHKTQHGAFLPCAHAPANKMQHGAFFCPT